MSAKTGTSVIKRSEIPLFFLFGNHFVATCHIKRMKPDGFIPFLPYKLIGHLS